MTFSSCVCFLLSDDLASSSYLDYSHFDKWGEGQGDQSELITPYCITEISNDRNVNNVNCNIHNIRLRLRFENLTPCYNTESVLNCAKFWTHHTFFSPLTHTASDSEFVKPLSHLNKPYYRKFGMISYVAWILQNNQPSSYWVPVELQKRTRATFTIAAKLL